MDKTGPQGRCVAFEWLHTWDRKAHCPWCMQMHGMLVRPSRGSPRSRHTAAPPWGCCHQWLWVVALTTSSDSGGEASTLYVRGLAAWWTLGFVLRVVSGCVCRCRGRLLSVPQEDVLTMPAAQRNDAWCWLLLSSPEDHCPGNRSWLSGPRKRAGPARHTVLSCWAGKAGAAVILLCPCEAVT